MSAHRHIEPFERCNDLFGLACPYLVDVVQDPPGIHNRNRLPWSRLFLVRASPSGRDAVTHGRDRWPLTAGDALFMPPDQMLGFDFEPGLRMVAFHFRLDWAPGCDAFAARARCVRLTRRHALVAEAYRLLRAGDGLDAIAGLRGLLLSAAALFLDGDAEEPARRLAARGRFAPVLARLEAAPRADLRVESLAALVGLGREHFTRELRRRLGVSPKRLLHRLLVDRAGALLVEGRRVKDVASALGFADEFYFSRFFKARTGLSPRAFRERALSPYGG